MKRNEFIVLLAEDNTTDVLIMREALLNTEREVILHVVSDGDAACAFLQQSGSFAGAPRPDLIFLDLNMPRKNGIEVLEHAKTDPALCGIPVIMLTTSRAEEDVARAYAAHANCYLRKPADFSDFAALIRQVTHFWLFQASMVRN
ncbi:MAG: response regulator [Herminiimonas sp.]|nr:response regulator [Herminiimonas sp.]